MKQRTKRTEDKNGKREEKIEIAKKMKKQGIDIKIIKSITNLSIDEIKEL